MGNSNINIEAEADHIYTNFEHYSRHYSKSGYYKVWLSTLKYIKGKVVDLGCGPGQYMQLCLDNDIDYTGYDISGVAISKAKEIAKGYKSVKLYKADLFEVDIDNSDTYVCCEMLEHIEKDHELLSKIKGKLVFTVPNYLGGSHVRKFDTLLDVMKRYDYIEYEAGETIKLSDTAKIHILSGWLA
jgi:SAM-dependent methyltransferase